MHLVKRQNSMEYLKPLLIGVVIGGGAAYWLDGDCPKVEIKEVKKIDFVKENSPLVEKKEDFEADKRLQRKEPMKTPDELYEEQQKAIEDSEVTYSDEFVQVDKTVVSIKQEQAENKSVEAMEIIDRTIISEELQKVESFVMEVVNNETASPEAMEIVEQEETIEIKEAISDELRVLEEYGDDEVISNDGNIPS